MNSKSPPSSDEHGIAPKSSSAEGPRAPHVNDQPSSSRSDQSTLIHGPLGHQGSAFTFAKSTTTATSPNVVDQQKGHQPMEISPQFVSHDYDPPAPPPPQEQQVGSPDGETQASDGEVFKLVLTANDNKFIVMIKGSMTMAQFAKLVEKQYYQNYLQDENPNTEARVLGVVNAYDEFLIPLTDQHLVKDVLSQDQQLNATIEIGAVSTMHQQQQHTHSYQTQNGDETLTKVESHSSVSSESYSGAVPYIYVNPRPYDFHSGDGNNSPPPPPPPGPPPSTSYSSSGGPILAQVLATRLPTRQPGSPLGQTIRALSGTNSSQSIIPNLNLAVQKVMNQDDEMSDSDIPLSQVVAKEREEQRRGKKSYGVSSPSGNGAPGQVVQGATSVPNASTPTGAHEGVAAQEMPLTVPGTQILYMPSPHTFISPQGKLPQPQQQPEGEELADGTWKCLKCEKILTSRRALWRHEVNAHQMPTNYQCSYCLKFLTGPSKLNKHIRLHLGIKDFQCNICSNRLSSRRQLDMHMRLHSKDPKYTCRQCNRSFTRTSNLKSHMRTHTGEKPFKCKTCGRAFAHKFVLQRHERVHTGETPFICHICHKGFKQSSNLKVHLRNHSDERPYKCNLCAKAFKQNANLIAHLRSAHRVRPVSRKNMSGSNYAGGSVYQPMYPPPPTSNAPPPPTADGAPPPPSVISPMPLHAQSWTSPPPPGHHLGVPPVVYHQQQPHHQ